jgi:hypothetical protein
MSDQVFAERYQPVYERVYSEACIREGYLGDVEGEARGLSADLREAAIAQGALVRVAPGVVRLALFPASHLEHVILAWHATGARGVFSHQTALALLGLCELGEVLHLTLPPGAEARAEPRITLHEAEVPYASRIWRAGVPITRVERAFADCEAGGAEPEIVAAALAKARRRKLVAPAPEAAGGPPQVRDAVLRLALLDALVPLAELREHVESSPRAALLAWVAARAIPDDSGEDGPLEALKWSDGAMLAGALPDGSDGRIRDVEGIGAFSALRALDLRGSCLESLAPLAALEELEVLHVGVPAATSLDPLLALPSLRRVRLDGFDAAAHGAACAELSRRGVVVDVVSNDPPSGAPFSDPMLKLAVLEALAGAGLVELPPLIPIDEDELDQAHLGRLLAIPLGEGQLAAVETLCWAGGGMSIQHLVWPQYDGESEAFSIRTLAGIELMPNLRAVELDAGALDPGSEELSALRARGIEVTVL